MYLEAVGSSFGAGVDCAMLQKIYGSSPVGEKRYIWERVGYWRREDSAPPTS